MHLYCKGLHLTDYYDLFKVYCDSAHTLKQNIETLTSLKMSNLMALFTIS